MRIALTVLLCAAALGVLAGPASALEFTDWTARTDSAVTGSLLGHPVTLTGPTTVGGDVLDGISQVFDYDLFTPRPPRRPARRRVTLRLPARPRTGLLEIPLTLRAAGQPALHAAVTVLRA